MMTDRKMTATTRQAERQRQDENAIGLLPDAQDGVRKVVGVISKVNEEKPRLVKANSIDGSPIANGGWIELNHSADEIAERWGTVRTGFRIRATVSGPDGSGADAVIIGVEGQDVIEPVVLNDSERGLFAIFPPGVG